LAGLQEEKQMAKVTLKEFKGTLEAIADGVLLDPATKDHAYWAQRIKDIVPTLDTFRSVKTEAGVTAYAFEKMGDTDTADIIAAALKAVR